MMATLSNTKQCGAVSLFIVVFAALLITVISVGFVGIMVQDQQQASSTDLSQSAYDSAQAGVEDAKRALLLYQSICNSGGDCSAAQAKIDSTITPACNVSVQTLDDVKGSVSANGEVAVKTGGNNALDQAYTCVKIKLDTDDYLGTLSSGDYDIIPLTSVSAFNTIQIQWFDSKNISSDKNYVVDLPSTASGTSLFAQNDWPPNRPPIMRTQLIQFGSNGFSLSDLDSSDNSDTLFLYPSTIVGTGSFSSDLHKTPTGKPQFTKCANSLIGGGYACMMSLALPNINGGNRSAFLIVTSVYNGTNFRITLLNNGAPVKFKGVQPEIDSTGRTNDLFRRVQSRVKLIDGNFPYPEAAVDVTGNFCKNFTITDSVVDYTNSCTL